MTSENISVDEVVVTALGVSREKKSLGYSVQEVKGDEINISKGMILHLLCLEKLPGFKSKQTQTLVVLLTLLFVGLLL